MKRMIFVLCMGSACITGCSDPNAANEKNFKAALNEYLEKNPACLHESYRFPKSDWLGGSFKALTGAGLVMLVGKGKHGESTYDLTPEGKKYFEKVDGKDYGRFCYAKVQLSEIKNFTQPNSVVGMTISEVAFTYKLDNVVPWGRNEDIQKAYWDVKHEIEGDQKDVIRKTLVLTNKGWKVDGV